MFTEQQEVMQVAEFFIHPENRRKGIGKAAITELWRRFPGKWELQVHKRNLGAAEFWISCIKVASSFHVIDEITHNDGQRLFFHFTIPSSEIESNIIGS
jgi:ribosomal-protein-alanine N-acetyltransferase